jgi:hypothetical protein
MAHQAGVNSATAAGLELTTTTGKVSATTAAPDFQTAATTSVFGGFGTTKAQDSLQEINSKL